MKHFQVLFARSFDDVVGQDRRRRLLVPLERKQIIAHKLLVEALLDNAYLIAVLRPEPGGIGRKHLIDKNDLAVEDAELQLGVRNDDALRLGDLAGLAVDGQRIGTDLFGNVLSDQFQTLSKSIFVSCSPDLGLGRGSKYRLRQPRGLRQPRRAA